VEFGVVIPTSGPACDAVAIRDGVQAAEELGFGMVWFGDHVVIPSYALGLAPPLWFEPLSAAFVCAGATTRIRLSIDVLVLPYRNPVELSQRIASADQLCGGRLTLGIGVGYLRGEFEALGVPTYAERSALTDEYLEAMRTLWEGQGAVSFSGRWVRFSEIHAEPKPEQNPFPLWIGGNRAASRQRAARWGNGWHPLFPTPDRYRAGRAHIERLRAEAGAEGDFTFSYSCHMTRIVHHSSERAGPTQAGYAGRKDIPEEFRYAPSKPVTDLGRQLLVGSPEEFAADVGALADAGVDHLALRFTHAFSTEGMGGFVEQLERFANEVRPMLPADLR
jgi:probable F420-dependent oxidoreductase